MDIEPRDITVKELVQGYQDDSNGDGGVTGYGGKLNIRPPYQREFVYKDKQRDAVIETVFEGYPLNVMYWADCGEGTFEVIDGQQRTISLCQYINGDFSVEIGDIPYSRSFHNLQDDEQQEIEDYKLMVYVCSGTDSEKLKWFETVNIAGEKLTDQELRNAVYSGPWVTDAKRYFSRTNGAASGLAGDYLKGSAIRQDYLETAIKWISDTRITEYMAAHQYDLTANELWTYFCSVVEWVEAIFKVKRDKIMKGVDWGGLYNKHGSRQDLNPNSIEDEIKSLIDDEDVQNHSGIYPYILTRADKHLNIRTFSPQQKQRVYEKQEGICPHCKEHFELDRMEADHITPWSLGGKTEETNCQMLCKDCNRRKGAK